MPNLVNGYLIIYSSTDERGNILDGLLKGYGVTGVNRLPFDFDSELLRRRHDRWRERIPEGYHINMIDHRLAVKHPG